MRKIILSLSKDYVPSWTIVDGIRELFQNALDQEVQNPTNKASWTFENGTLRICNKSSALTARTLLLGTSTKEHDEGTVGQFGEGYKIAALVLLREGKQMTIYNYALREVWRPRFVRSRTFGTDVLAFFIDKEYPWSCVPDNNLTIEVSGITDEEWHKEIVPSNLYLQEDVEREGTSTIGEILTGAAHAGLVFVNGLYVCKYTPYTFGYNFKPGQLKLDRDRKLASDFDLRWLASKMWVTHPNAILHVEKGLADVSYLHSMSAYVEALGSGINLHDAAYRHFRLVHGAHAVPIVSQEQAEEVPIGYTSIVVNSCYRELITSSSLYQAPTADSANPTERLRTWFSSIEDKLSYAECSQFEKIWEDLQ